MFEATLNVIEEARKNVIENGPTRVYVNGEGLGYRAAREAGIIADAALVRYDGWTLGFDNKDEEAAKATWENEWVAKINIFTGEVELIDAT